MSTSPVEANLAASWKQEVNRRLQAHKNRKPGFAPEPVALAAHQTAASRAAQAAAARVAARYAKAPSYSQMLAEEARTAVRAAEAASRAALDLQAAAESVLAELEAATAAEQLRAAEFRVLSSDRAFDMAWEANAAPARTEESLPAQQQEPRAYGIRWDEDLPALSTESVNARVSHGPSATEAPLDPWWEEEAAIAASPEPIESVEPLQPIPANLIEFPRELVAIRKMRPRRAESPFGETADTQLSIFEVDPGSISMEPEPVESPVAGAAPAWQPAEWSDIRLGEHPVATPSVEDELVRDIVPAPPTVQLAPLGLRFMATLVDCALITSAFLAAAMVAATHVSQLPQLRDIEIGSALALAGIGALYHALFLVFAEGTPGMKYAHIALCTFDDENPTGVQRRRRLVSMLLSLAPVGLGVAWALFDDDHLTWHDRLSGTYLRRF